MNKAWNTIIGLSFLLVACGSEPSLSGKYQSEDEGIGIDFLEEGNAILYGNWGDRVAVEYEILKGEDSLNLKIEEGESSTIMELELEPENITLSYLDEQLVLQKVDAFTLTSPPSLAQQARESEGKQYIGAMNRAQQAYFLEYAEFSDSIDKLGLGIEEETDNYRYSTEPTPEASINRATPKSEDLKAFVGGAFIVTPPGLDYQTTMAIVCEATEPNTIPEPPFAEGEEVFCAEGSDPL
jgi:hypothetical protein